MVDVNALGLVVMFATLLSLAAPSAPISFLGFIVVITRGFLLLVSTARVFLLIPPHVVFDFPSLPASAS